MREKEPRQKLPKMERVIVGYIMPALLGAGYITYLLTGLTAPIITIVLINLAALIWHAKRRIERD